MKSFYLVFVLSVALLIFVWFVIMVMESQHEKRLVMVFICIPVRPGRSRLIWTFPRNFGVWIDKVIPRWMFHIGQNLILDSDLYLLHVEVTFLLLVF